VLSGAPYDLDDEGLAIPREERAAGVGKAQPEVDPLVGGEVDDAQARDRGGGVVAA